MKLATPNEQDINGALEVARILSDLSSGWFPSNDADEDVEFDIGDGDDCRKALEMLIDIENKCTLMRAAMTTLVLCDPRNKVIDHSIDYLDHHPEIKAAVELKTKIDSFFTQKFTGGMKFITRDGVIREIASANFEEGLVAFTDGTDDDLQWVRWENITLIEEDEVAA